MYELFIFIIMLLGYWCISSQKFVFIFFYFVVTVDQTIMSTPIYLKIPPVAVADGWLRNKGIFKFDLFFIRNPSKQGEGEYF